jgi:hypothetical protein
MLPSTDNPINVPSVVKLLLVISDPSVVPVKKFEPFNVIPVLDKRFPEKVIDPSITRFPSWDTENPGLSNPVPVEKLFCVADFIYLLPVNVFIISKLTMDFEFEIIEQCICILLLQLLA